MDLSQIYLYRMTHIGNITHILAKGITHKNPPEANPDYLPIGDRSLISIRESKQVKISNGNRAQSFGTITLGDFIPFYFDARMPMLYVIQHGGNYVEKASDREDVIYLVCRLNDIVQSGTKYYFSDGHATDVFTQFYDNLRIAELPAIIDWTAVKSIFWAGDDNLELKRKKQAEFLVADDIEQTNIYGFVCYNNMSKQRLTGMGVDANKIAVRPLYYF